MNDCGEVKVNKQVLVSFSIGKYKDEVLCDVVPMHAIHILLGRLWQFHRKVNHDGFKNRHSFAKDNKTITLVLLTLRQVYEDQMKLKRENDVKKKKCEIESSKKDDEKESEREKESEETERKTKKQVSFYAKASDVKSAFDTNQPIFVLLYKEACFNSNEFDESLPSFVVSLLQEYEDVFPNNVPSRLPPIKGIEHACSLPSAGDRSNIILGVPRSNHNEQGKFKDHNKK